MNIDFTNERIIKSRSNAFRLLLQWAGEENARQLQETCYNESVPDTCKVSEITTKAPTASASSDRGNRAM